MKVKFLLHSNSFSERGDSVTLLSLATAMREHLGVYSTITFPTSATEVSEIRLKEAALKGIPIFQYSSKADLDEFAEVTGITHTYVFSSGRKEDLPYYDAKDPESFRVGRTKHITHVVFRNYAPHGDIYAYVSEWLFDWSKPLQYLDRLRGKPRDVAGLGKTLVVSFPHFIQPWPEVEGSTSIRKSLGIAEDSFVIGRIGGLSEFSDKAAQKTLLHMVTEHEDVHVILVNTNSFCDHPRVHFVDELSREEVGRFYDSCDLLLNGRKMGESFGYSIVEPLSLGKPVIGPDWMRNPIMDKHHIRILRPLGLLYRSSSHLVSLINHVRRKPPNRSDLLLQVDRFRVERAMATLRDSII